MSSELTPRAVERLLEVGAPLADRPEAGAVDTERYELGRELGRGGMGVVYEAWDKDLGRKIALKILAQPAGVSSAGRQRFLREARAAARLVHPNIATVYDATPEAIAMQKIEGDTLADRPVEDPRELAALLRDAALAIHFAHGQGIVHRDLKPANLMVEPGDRPHVYVMDFGLAKELAVESSLSLSGNVVGTPAYMAPEQAEGRSDAIGAHTDVYGLGATLYACLGGSAPFAGDDVYRVLRSVVDAEPRPLREVSARIDRDLATIAAKCMAKEPARRYATALAVASDLDRWLRGEPIQARPPSLMYRLRRYVSRRQGAIVAGAAAAGVALLVALPFLMQARAKRDAAERERQLAEDVFTLSLRVGDALREARATRGSGVGHELSAFTILKTAIGECRAFLAGTEAGHVRFFLGRLLAEQGLPEEALVAFDRADELFAGIDQMPRERGLVLASLYRDHVPVLGEAARPELESWRVRAGRDLGAARTEKPDVPTPDWLFLEGQLAWVSGDRAAAVGKLREAVEMDVAHQEAHLSLSRLYLLEDRQDLGMRHSVIASDLLRGYRPAYLAQIRSGSGEKLDPRRELLPLEGMRELMVDFNLLLSSEPGDAHTYGMRGQVQARQALRALGKEARLEARKSLELAAQEFSRTLGLRRGHAPALVDRGVCRAQLARVFSGLGDNAGAAEALSAALEDYDAAIRYDDRLAVAWYDRALLRQRRARLAQLARSPIEARNELDHALDDARAALARVDDDHPWRWRFEALVEELE